MTNSEDQSVFKFTGSDNTLTVKGNNTFSSAGDSAVINVGDGLSVQGDGSLNISKPSDSLGAGIGSDSGETGNGDILISGVTITAKVYDGAAIGSGGNGGSIGNIIVEDSTLDLNGHFNANIGSGHSKSSCGDITIVHSNMTSQNVDTGIGSGYYESTSGNIDIYNSTMNINSQLSACIGSGDKASCGDIYVSNSTIVGKSNVGACIGTGQNNATSGDITVVNGTKVKHTSPDGAAIGSGRTGKVTGKIYYSKSIEVDASACYVDEADKAHPGIGRGRNGSAEVGDFEEINDSSEYKRIVKHVKGNPLWVQHGTQAGQHTNFYINDMQVKALGLEGVEVTTRDKATAAIASIESALERALDEATTMGAYLQRLEYTETNVTTMGENVQASESTIRDADMAKEMVEYAKYNLLSQSSQSMLAQANQAHAQVLNLLG